MKRVAKTWVVFGAVVVAMGILGYQKSQLNGGEKDMGLKKQVEKVEKSQPGEVKTAKVEVEKKEALKKAPEWELKNLKGGIWKSSELKGKVGIVSFWTTWCPSCRKEIGVFVELQKAYKEKDLQIVGVALDRGKPEKIVAFAEGMGIAYPVLAGTVQVVKAFGDFSVIPSTFVIDREGNIVKYIRGAAPKKQLEELVNSLL